MEFSKELIFIEAGKILVYNYKLNKACIINKNVYDFLKNNDISGFKKNITEKDYELLLKNGVIFEDESNYNRLAYSHKLTKIERKIDLKLVYLHITQHCNLSCSYCYNHRNLNKPDGINTNDISFIANILKNVGVETIVLTGGEALLRDDIIEVCKILKNFDFKLQLLTNGTMLSIKQEILDLLDKVIISIDTFDQTKNARNGLDVLKLKEDLLRIDSSQKYKITLRSVVTHLDEVSFKDIKSFASLNGFNFLQAVFIPNKSSDINLIPSIDVIEPDAEDCLLKASSCGACYNEIAIDSNGDIYPCQALIRPELKVSNIFKTNWMQELKNSDVTNMFLKRKVDNIENCSSCEYRYLCGGGCPTMPYNLYGTLFNCAKPLCGYIKQNIEKNFKRILEKY
ncbi:radical SAM/SPASM domain-containing protein [Clostridium felsineum]|uniref:radical SAM/SPASM domain-containing protein n=1 Tax=Clostridium felsineum TaxID=36839 RepID=UPI00098C9AFF|nr:SPASM domain-containing protein [Clostridium felsineum]URZ00743.1 GTP 3',8-cyclase [Clostridium felsineum]